MCKLVVTYICTRGQKRLCPSVSMLQICQIPNSSGLLATKCAKHENLSSLLLSTRLTTHLFKAYVLCCQPICTSPQPHPDAPCGTSNNVAVWWSSFHPLSAVITHSVSSPMVNYLNRWPNRKCSAFCGNVNLGSRP